MAWAIELTATALRQLGKLDRSEARRITHFLRTRLATSADPREMGKRLTGPELGSYWRYRIGNYRVLCDIQDAQLVILVVEVGHRSSIYR